MKTTYTATISVQTTPTGQIDVELMTRVFRLELQAWALKQAPTQTATPGVSKAHRPVGVIRKRSA